MNIFQFKHVGKGLFYTGSINDDINFVYDCGTADSERALKSEITGRIFCDNKKINFIIISGIKKEFINGLPSLCANYSVKKIYLPYLGADKELIRLILFITIFKNTEMNREDLELYSLMCKLYGVKTYNFNVYDVPLPEVIFLGAPNAETNVCQDDGKVISRYENIADNAFWKFIVINRTVGKECFESAAVNFGSAFKQFFRGGNFNKKRFEAYMFMQSGVPGGLEELRIKSKKIFQWGSGMSELSENVLIHYPSKPFYGINLCEYKNSFNKSTASVLHHINGTITLLLGDAQIDKALEEHIFATGNYSLCAGILQIPYRYITEQNQNIISLARPFEDFVFAANAGTENKFSDSGMVKDIRSVYKRIHISSQHTGIGYFIEPAKNIF